MFIFNIYIYIYTYIRIYTYIYVYIEGADLLSLKWGCEEATKGTEPMAMSVCSKEPELGGTTPP